MALFLGLNRKRIHRIMRQYGIHPKIMRGRPRKPGDAGKPTTTVPNLAKTLILVQANVLWAGDFTYIPWRGDFLYVATVIDVFTREIVGWHVGMRHTTDLVIRAFLDAAERTGTVPLIFHSDQGSEYVSGQYDLLLANLGVQASQSRKSSPWENGFQESFYNQFKLELGSSTRFHDLGALVEAIHRQMRYYNRDRIHLALKMLPAAFRRRHEQQMATAGAVA